MIILCDVDCVVADLMPEWIRLYNNDYSDSLTVDQITEWEMTKFVHPDCGTKIYSYLTYETLYDNVKPIEGSQDGVAYIRSLGHRVVFVSSGIYAHPKFYWLEKHNFDLGKFGRDFVVAHDKSLINGDMLIDDGVHNIEAFPEFKYAFLFDQPWNRDYEQSHRVKWQEIKDTFERYF